MSSPELSSDQPTLDLVPSIDAVTGNEVWVVPTEASGAIDGSIDSVATPQPTVENVAPYLIDTQPVPVVTEATNTTEVLPVQVDESSVAILGLRKHINKARLWLTKKKVDRLYNDNHAVTKRASADALKLRGTNGITPVPQNANSVTARKIEARNQDIAKHQPTTWLDRRIAIYRARQFKKARMFELGQQRRRKERGEDFDRVTPREKFDQEKAQYGRAVRSLAERRSYTKEYRRHNKTIKGGLIKRNLHLPVGSDRIRKSLEKAARGESPMQRFHDWRSDLSKLHTADLEKRLEDADEKIKNAKELKTRQKEASIKIKEFNKRWVKNQVRVEPNILEVDDKPQLLRSIHDKRFRSNTKRATKLQRKTVALERRARRVGNDVERERLEARTEKLKVRKSASIKRARHHLTERDRKRITDVSGWI